MILRNKKNDNDDSKRIEVGSKKLFRFMSSFNGIGLLILFAIFIFFLCVLLYTLLGEKPLLYLSCFLGSAFFFGRNLIGGNQNPSKI